MAGACRDALERMEAAFLSRDPDHLMYEDGWQADAIRCVFRSPFQSAAADQLHVEPRIRDMAESIYRLRAFDKMPALGKELEASGCVDPELVSHCIDAHVHVRGCWALDMARGVKRDGKAHDAACAPRKDQERTKTTKTLTPFKASRWSGVSWEQTSGSLPLLVRDMVAARKEGEVTIDGERYRVEMICKAVATDDNP
jgi:hypothetical protein